MLLADSSSEHDPSAKAISIRPEKQGIIGMYGPPQCCKRKTKNGIWSAPMYSAFSGVNDSGP
jgi:hypothetical protein